MLGFIIKMLLVAICSVPAAMMISLTAQHDLKIFAIYLAAYIIVFTIIWILELQEEYDDILHS